MAPIFHMPTTRLKHRETRLQLSVSVGCYVRMFDRQTYRPERVSGTVINLSRGGMFIRIDEVCSPEAEVVIELTAGGDDAPIAIDAWVVHATDDGIGIQFGTLAPPAQTFVDRQLNLKPTP